MAHKIYLPLDTKINFRKSENNVSFGIERVCFSSSKGVENFSLYILNCILPR